MCGRYYIADDDSSLELQSIIAKIQHRNPAVMMKTGEIRPTDIAPVIANNSGLAPTPFVMKWGYTLPNGQLLFNSRSETASTKPIFRDGMAQRRCLIPASNYSEWEKRGVQKVKYAIRPSGSPALFMAGIYRIESGKPVFSILTRSPADSIAFIQDRMPVILPSEAKADWLNIRNRAEDVLRAAVMDYLPYISFCLR